MIVFILILSLMLLIGATILAWLLIQMWVAMRMGGRLDARDLKMLILALMCIGVGVGGLVYFKNQSAGTNSAAGAQPSATP